MSPLALAQQYLDIFFSGQDYDRLLDLLADDLEFSGPFLESGSAKAYVEAIAADPPRDVAYEVLWAFEEGNVANVIYRMSKPGLAATLSQLFEVEGDRIIKICLIFDSYPFRALAEEG